LIGGTFLLSNLLLPQLKAAKPGRVVINTSGGMYNTKFPKWDTFMNTDGKPYDSLMSYSYAKRGQVLLAERLSEEHNDVIFVVGHPGWSDTPGVDDAFGSQKRILNPMRTPWQGSEGLTWLMSTTKENLQSGALYLDRTVRTKHIAGLFMTEGTYTKNSKAEVDEMMLNLKKSSGL